MLLLALPSALAGGAIYVQENDDGTISFTDQATVAHAQGWEVFIGEKYLLPPQQVSVQRFPALDDYDGLILDAAMKHGVDAALIKAVCFAESAMQPNAVSKAGAQGLMQLMPATAKGLRVDPFDPAQAIDGGTRYLKAQLETFGGSIKLTLAAYNAGPQNVKKYGGVPPFEETQRYVQRVMALYEWFRYERPIGSKAG